MVVAKRFPTQGLYHGQGSLTSHTRLLPHSGRDQDHSPPFAANSKDGWQLTLRMSQECAFAWTPAVPVQVQVELSLQGTAGFPIDVRLCR
jgi:hypothetical protein